MTVIDKTVRNKWSWKWTEKLVDGTILDLTLGECIRKLPRAGLAYQVLFVLPVPMRCTESRLESHRAALSEGQAQRRKEDKLQFARYLPGYPRGMQCVFSAAIWRDLLPVLGFSLSNSVYTGVLCH